jgi:hypothetical protein
MLRKAINEETRLGLGSSPLERRVVITREVYVMRVWQDSEDSESWPVTMTTTCDGQSYTFANLDTFVAFFKERLADLYLNEQS